MVLEGDVAEFEAFDNDVCTVLCKYFICVGPGDFVEVADVIGDSGILVRW